MIGLHADFLIVSEEFGVVRTIQYHSITYINIIWPFYQFALSLAGSLRKPGWSRIVHI
jgi:hypothetical protein